MIHGVHGALGARSGPLKDRLVAAGCQVQGARGSATASFDNAGAESLAAA